MKEGNQDTIINRFNGDIGNHTSTMPNQTSVKDTGKSMLYLFKEAQAGNHFAQDLLDIFKSELSSKDGIAKGAESVDKGITVHNFRASYTECENDTAVISYGENKIIISIMVSNLTDNRRDHTVALENIRELSKQILSGFS